MNDLRQWRAAIERHESYDELILWFEHDLFDQLNLIQLLTWIRERLPAAKPVSLVCIGSFPGHPRFKGLGELSAGRAGLAARHAAARSATGKYSLAERAWQAFREPTPEALDDSAPDGHGRAALSSPPLSRGSSRNIPGPPTDSLEPSAGSCSWQSRSRSISRRHSHACMTAKTPTTSPTRRWRNSPSRLSRTSPPLLTFTPGRMAGRELLQGSVTLTDAGRAVLAGRLDRVAVCGIDRWFGGVHLHGDAWRWDDQRQRITRQPASE